MLDDLDPVVFAAASDGLKQYWMELSYAIDVFRTVFDGHVLCNCITRT